MVDVTDRSEPIELDKLPTREESPQPMINRLSFASQPSRQEAIRRRRGRRWLFACGGVIVLALALGLGLGLGLKHHSSEAMTETTPASSATAPGNSSDITTLISRDQLLGDQTRWSLASRNFDITAAPQTREFNWTISEVNSAPGALVKPMIVVNGISPGPVLEANMGDRLLIHIFNNMTNETSMHWHGQYLQNQNYMDGTYSITQCGIPPGGSMTYNWTVQQWGTSWYHAHKEAQYTDGMVGPIVFHAPNETAMTANHYDDDYTFLLSDMYNTQASALTWRFEAIGTGLDGNPGDEPAPDGGLMNGISQATCAFIPASDTTQPERRKRGLVGPPNDGLAKRANEGGTFYPATNYCGNETTVFWNVTWTEGQTYRIRLINAGTFADTIFSIDNHPLTVIEADGISVEPYVVSSVDLGVAQRYSVLVTLNQTAGAYWIRNVVAQDQLRYTTPNFNETTFGILRYNSISVDTMPANEPSPDLAGVADFDSTTLVPADPIDAQPATNAVWVQFGMQYTDNNQHYMFFNSSSWTPLSPGGSSMQAIQNMGVSTFSNNATAATEQLMDGRLGSQLVIVNDNSTYMDLVVNSLDDGSHPFHLHGHTFQIMSQGSEGFHTSTAGLNTTNPMRRDTIIIPSYGHVVLRINTDNPGIWAFHCHITWHMEIGLLLTLVDLPDQIAAFDIPADELGLCSSDQTIGF